MSPGKTGLGDALFNPGIVQDNAGIHMLFRIADGDFGSRGYVSTIGYARLSEPTRVVELRETPLIAPTLPEESAGCEDCRIVSLDHQYYLFYTAYDGQTARVAVASTLDFTNITKLGVLLFDHWDKDAFIFPGRINGKIAYMHRIEPSIQLLMVDTIEELLDVRSHPWEAHLKAIGQETVLRPTYAWEVLKIGAGPPPLQTEAGWLLIYHGVDRHSVYRVGAALLDQDDPYRVIARLPYPILEPIEEYERVGDVPNVVFPQGLTVIDDVLYVYYGAADKVIALASIKVTELIDELNRHQT